MKLYCESIRKLILYYTSFGYYVVAFSMDYYMSRSNVINKPSFMLHAPTWKCYCSCFRISSEFFIFTHKLNKLEAISVSLSIFFLLFLYFFCALKNRMNRCIDLLPNWDLFERNLLPTFMSYPKNNWTMIKYWMGKSCPIANTQPTSIVHMNQNEMKIYLQNLFNFDFSWSNGFYSLFATKH